MFVINYKWIKTIVVALCCLALLLLTAQAAQAQGDSYNPYLIQGIVDETGASPGSTLVPAEFGGTGFVRFDVGNTGLDPLSIPPPGGNPNDVMTLVITLSKGVPDVTDPNDPADALNALSGTAVAWFDWSYDPGLRTYSATQIQTIPGQGRENITIAYQVTENSFLSQSPTISNGFNVNLQPPGYTNPQPTDDDAVSSYTYVEAADYGDNPPSYGVAEHSIDVAKNGGLYNEYVYLGATVDPEDVSQDSAAADGDDSNQTNNLNPTDDENGVTLPAVLVLGETVDIPIVMTIQESGFAFLNGWIDWNGNGVFDVAEQIISNFPVFAPGTTTQNISVAVPADAVEGETFARFRFGSPAGPTGPAAYGEVEDYPITIDDGLAVTLSYFYAERDDNVVNFTWETATESGNAGFNLYKVIDDESEPVIVNPTLIPSTVIDSVTTTQYNYAASVDGEEFLIEMLSISGRRELNGPYQLGEEFGSPSAPGLQPTIYLPLVVRAPNNVSVARTLDESVVADVETAPSPSPQSVDMTANPIYLPLTTGEQAYITAGTTTEPVESVAAITQSGDIRSENVDTDDGGVSVSNEVADTTDAEVDVSDEVTDSTDIEIDASDDISGTTGVEVDPAVQVVDATETEIHASGPITAAIELASDEGSLSSSDATIPDKDSGLSAGEEPTGSSVESE